MRILMLGNSFTFYNDMPSMLAELTGAEVVHHTRGGARLAEQLNPETQMGAKTLEALEKEAWDYVVLQEMSNGPITSRESFLNSVASLCEKIRAAGATPILYATWAYRKDCDKLEEMGLEYDVMAAQLSEAYHEAADQNEALIAEVGKRFYEQAGRQSCTQRTANIRTRLAPGLQQRPLLLLSLLTRKRKRLQQYVLPQYLFLLRL